MANAVFIIGSARSGTTLLYETLCNHRDIAYITDRMDYEYHDRLLKARYGSAQVLKWKMKGNYHTGLWWPAIRQESAPNEANSFWLMHLPHWKHMTESDVNEKMKSYFQKQALSIMQSQRKPVFLNKNPHHSYRVRLLDAIFPDCKFIHIVRDGRAVAYSELVRRTEEWDDKPIIENILKDRYKPERSYLYNIGQEWHCMTIMAREAARFGRNRYTELRYEDLIREPKETFLRMLDFCGLDSYDDFVKKIPKTTDENVKWKSKLDNKQIADIEEATAELRQELGYHDS